jgi:hypothetical protein
VKGSSTSSNVHVNNNDKNSSNNNNKSNNNNNNNNDKNGEEHKEEETLLKNKGVLSGHNVDSNNKGLKPLNNIEDFEDFLEHAEDIIPTVNSKDNSEILHIDPEFKMMGSSVLKGTSVGAALINYNQMNQKLDNLLTVNNMVNSRFIVDGSARSSHYASNSPNNSNSNSNNSNPGGFKLKFSSSRPSTNNNNNNYNSNNSNNNNNSNINSNNILIVSNSGSSNNNNNNDINNTGKREGMFVRNNHSWNENIVMNNNNARESVKATAGSAVMNVAQWPDSPTRILTGNSQMLESKETVFFREVEAPHYPQANTANEFNNMRRENNRTANKKTKEIVHDENSSDEELDGDVNLSLANQTNATNVSPMLLINENSMSNSNNTYANGVGTNSQNANNVSYAGAQSQNNGLLDGAKGFGSVGDVGAVVGVGGGGGSGGVAGGYEDMYDCTTTTMTTQQNDRGRGMFTQFV